MSALANNDRVRINDDYIDDRRTASTGTGKSGQDEYGGGMVAMIEQGRKSPQNPALPDDLRAAYVHAWRGLAQIGLKELAAAEEPLLVSSIIAVLAMGKGQFQLRCFVILFDESERKARFNDAGWP
jgi:hypothetical protein